MVAKILKFNDDTKVGMNVAREGYKVCLQENLRNLWELSDTWQMYFNVNMYATETPKSVNKAHCLFSMQFLSFKNILFLSKL